MRTTTINVLRILLVAALPALSACTSADFATELPETPVYTPGKTITINAVFGDDAPATRLGHTYNTNNTIDVEWTTTDAFKMYKGGKGTEFTVATLGTPATTASFTGTLPEDKGIDKTYKFFYPAHKAAEYESQAVMSVLGQVQVKASDNVETAGQNMNHLSDYNYMVVTGTTGEPTSITFTPAIAVLRIPLAGYSGYTLKSLTMSLENNQDIVVVQNAFTTDKQTSKNHTLVFSGYDVNKGTTAYMAVFGSTLRKGSEIYFTAAYADASGTVLQYVSKKVEITAEGGLPFSAAKVYNVSIAEWKKYDESGIDNAFTYTGTETASTYFSGDSSADGSEAKPYLISSAADLKKLIDGVNNSATNSSYTGKYVKLTKNIHVTASSWTPIGNDNFKFQGHFDGGGHTISGALTSAAGTNYFGFFGKATGTIKNLHVAADVTGVESAIDVTGTVSVYGAIVGLAGGDIENCTMSGKLTYTAVNRGIHRVGGVIGHHSAFELMRTIKNCASLGEIEVTIENSPSEFYLGGVIGDFSYGAIENCINRTCLTVSVSDGTGEQCVGGITGHLFGATMNNCVNEGTIAYHHTHTHTGITAPIVYLGGITGKANGYSEGVCSIKNCRNYQAVTCTGVYTGDYGSSDIHVGGICGESVADYSSVHSSYNTGAVTTSGATTTKTKYVGGICGKGDAPLCNTNVGLVTKDTDDTPSKDIRTGSGSANDDGGH